MPDDNRTAVQRIGDLIEVLEPAREGVQAVTRIVRLDPYTETYHPVGGE